MTASAVILAVHSPSSPNGAWGLLVLLGLIVAVVLLFRSMNKHLRKAQRMKLEEQEHPTDAKPRGGRTR
jgi:hypothetical protein